MRNFSAGTRKVSIESDATAMYIHRMKNDFLLSFRFSFVEKAKKLKKKRRKKIYGKRKQQNPISFSAKDFQFCLINFASSFDWNRFDCKGIVLRYCSVVLSTKVYRVPVVVLSAEFRKLHMKPREHTASLHPKST